MKRLSPKQCERCPPPSREAAVTAVLETGSRRIKHERIYLCTACAERANDRIYSLTPIGRKP